MVYPIVIPLFTAFHSCHSQCIQLVQDFDVHDIDQPMGPSKVTMGIVVKASEPWQAAQAPIFSAWLKPDLPSCSSLDGF